MDTELGASGRTRSRRTPAPGSAVGCSRQTLAVSKPHIPSAVRRELEERAEGHCEACCISFACSKRRQEAHHLTSDRRGHELVPDLLLVCPQCHRACHDAEGTPPLPEDVVEKRRAAGRRAARRPAPPSIKRGRAFGPAYHRERQAGCRHEEATERAAAYTRALYPSRTVRA